MLYLRHDLKGSSRPLGIFGESTPFTGEWNSYPPARREPQKLNLKFQGFYHPTFARAPQR
jgi:hypothetical protein